MTISASCDCVVFGGTLVEQIVQIPRLPRPHQDNVPLSQMRTLPGGSGANVAVYLSRLGASVKLIDQWGSDPEAELLETDLHREGVDISFCRRLPGLTTPFMIILTLPDNDWTGITRIPEEAQLGPEDFYAEAITSGHFLHFHGFSVGTKLGQAGVERAIETAKSAGVSISLDACTPVALADPDAIRRLIPDCRLFYANTLEAQALTNRFELQAMASELLLLGADTVVIKAGEEGCYLMDARDGALIHIPAYPTQVIDTVGAGDGVVAGTLAGLISGHPLPAAVRLGVAAASLICQGIGAQSRMFTRQEAYTLAGLPIRLRVAENSG